MMPYRHSGSWLHRAGATAKIICLGCWFAVALLLRSPPALGALAVAVLALAAWAGLIPVLLRFSRFILVLFVMSALLWTVFSGASESGPQAAWHEDLAAGALMGLRLTTMMAMGLLFLASTRVEEMAGGLQRLGLPFVAAFSLTLAFRLIPLFAAAGGSIAQAQASRGVDVRSGGLFSRIRRHLPLLVPLVLAGLRSADRLAMALESRGLGMHARRTSIIGGELGGAGVAAVALCLGAALVVAALALSGAPL